MKPRVSILTLISLLIFAVILTGCGTSKTQQSGSSTQPTIGYIQAAPAQYYQLAADGAQKAAEVAGAKMIVLNSQGDPQKELSNVQDLIAKKVNAIILFTLNGETAQKAAQLANQANIPLFIQGSAASPGPGKVTSTVKGNFEHMGALSGEYVKKTWPQARVAIIEGALGQNISEPFTKGFTDAIKGSQVKVVATNHADWDRQKAMNVMQDMITAHKNQFDVVYVQNEDMCAGVVAALEQAGLIGKVHVVTSNGSPEGIDMIKKGEVQMTVANSPSYEAGVVVKEVMAYLHGQAVAPEVESPTRVITKDNLDQVLGWDVNAAVRAYNEWQVK